MEDVYFTSEQMDKEFLDLSHDRQGLRVSQPSRSADSEQRTWYLLQLPLATAAIHMSSSAAFHWWISVLISLRLAFLWRLGNPNPLPQLDPAADETLVSWFDATIKAWSDNAWPFFAFVCLLVIFAAPPCLHELCNAYISGRCSSSGYRKEVMPRSQGDSGIIAAACHPLEEEGDISMCRIKWGVVGPAGPDKDHPGHCAFSKNEAGFLKDGKYYA
jgi:hypothetical protein